MFRYLARNFAQPEQVFLVHPLQLSRWLETAWAAAPNAPVIGTIGGQTPELGSPTVIADFDLPDLLLKTLEPGIDPTDPGGWNPPGRDLTPLFFEHTAYAFLIESTGIVPIINKIVQRIVDGDTLGRLRPETLQWARATEELFLRDPPPFSITSVVSRARPIAEVERRRLYYASLGFDLPFGMTEYPSGGPAPWKTDVGNANTDFGPKFVEMLTQSWIGFTNRLNQTGENATDAQYVGLLCEAIHDMLGNCMQGGRQVREMFTAGAMLSWYHLTIEHDTPVVQDLHATATNPAERLEGLAQRVGMRTSPNTRQLIELAEPMSALLWGIQIGLFNQGASPESLYLPPVLNGPPSVLNVEVNRIIDLWQSVTGVRIKSATAPPVGGSVPRPSAQPLRTPTLAPVGPALVAASSNGHRT
jgi:hypothetical protein